MFNVALSNLLDSLEVDLLTSGNAPPLCFKLYIRTNIPRSLLVAAFLFRRGNTSMLVRIVREEEKSDNSGDYGDSGAREGAGDGGRGRHHGTAPRARHVQIDTGKTWREGVIRWFPR